MINQDDQQIERKLMCININKPWENDPTICGIFSKLHRLEMQQLSVEKEFIS